MTATDPMLVLAGETPVPPTSGIRLRVLHLARALAEAGPVRLGVLGPPGPVDAETFTVTADGELRPKLHSLATALRRPYAAARHAAPGLARLAAAGTWDVVMAETPWLIPAAVQARRPVLLDAHNVETRRHALPGPGRAPAGSPAAVALGGGQDGALGAGCGADRGGRPRDGRPRGRALRAPGRARGRRRSQRRRCRRRALRCARRPGARFVYVGHFGYRPNVLAATELAREVLPALRAEVPEASLALVGRDAGPEVRRLAGPGLTRAPERCPICCRTCVPRAARSSPLRAGAGTRLKVLEAMAAGVPVISTPFGVDGVDVRDGEHVLLAETPRELAAAAARVARDDALCRRLAERARRLVEERYDWRAATAPLVALRERLGARP